MADETKKAPVMGAPTGGPAGTGTQGPTEEEKLQQLLKTPITKEEAEEAYADIEVRRCQLTVIRQKWMAQLQQLQLRLNGIDSALVALDLERAVVFRRSLIPADGNAGAAAERPDGDPS